MSQHTIVIPTTPPLSGVALVNGANNAFQAIATDFAGPDDPAGVAPAFARWADTANGVLKRRNAAGTAWVVIGDLFQRSLSAYDSSEIPSSNVGPISVSPYGVMYWDASAAMYISHGCGAVDFFGMTSAPVGYLKANGAAVSRTTYAGLFARIGTTHGAGDGSATFNVPDLRGRFPRAWSDGGTTDSGRVLGSVQQTATQAHSHQESFGGFGTTVWMHRKADQNPFYDGVTITGSSAISLTGSSVSGATIVHALTDSALFIPSGESRPPNIALLACVKY